MNQHQLSVGVRICVCLTILYLFGCVGPGSKSDIVNSIGPQIAITEGGISGLYITRDSDVLVSTHKGNLLLFDKNDQLKEQFNIEFLGPIVDIAVMGNDIAVGTAFGEVWLARARKYMSEIDGEQSKTVFYPHLRDGVCAYVRAGFVYVNEAGIIRKVALPRSLDGSEYHVLEENGSIALSSGWDVWFYKGGNWVRNDFTGSFLSSMILHDGSVLSTTTEAKDDLSPPSSSNVYLLNANTNPSKIASVVVSGYLRGHSGNIVLISGFDRNGVFYSLLTLKTRRVLGVDVNLNQDQFRFGKGDWFPYGDINGSQIVVRDGDSFRRISLRQTGDRDDNSRVAPEGATGPR